MPTGFPDLTPEQVKAFIDGIGGSTSIDVADPILNPGMIIDNPKAVYDKLNQNAYVADLNRPDSPFEDGLANTASLGLYQQDFSTADYDIANGQWNNIEYTLGKI